MPNFPSLNIDIYQGDTYNLSAIVKNSDGSRYNLSGYSGVGVIRNNFCGDVLGNFNVSITNATSGEITASVHNTGTSNLPIGVWPYNIEFSSGTFVIKFLQGYCYVYPEVSTNFP